MGANAQTTVPTFTAGQVLTADQQNQSARTGVPVFAGTVERDAAFGGTGEKTLAEGQLCYLESTNVVQYYDGAAWATVGPQTLTSGLNYITGAAFTAVTSVALPTSTFTSTYRNYKVMYQFSSSASNSALTLRLRKSGTDNTAVSYEGGLILALSNSTAVAQGFATTSFALGNSQVGNQLAFDLTFYAPQVNQQTSFSGTVAGRTTERAGGAVGGMHDQTDQFDSVNLIVAGGTTITGVYRVYGLADS